MPTIDSAVPPDRDTASIVSCDALFQLTAASDMALMVEVT